MQNVILPWTHHIVIHSNCWDLQWTTKSKLTSAICASSVQSSLLYPHIMLAISTCTTSNTRRTVHLSGNVAIINLCKKQQQELVMLTRGGTDHMQFAWRDLHWLPLMECIIHKKSFTDVRTTTLRSAAAQDRQGLVPGYEPPWSLQSYVSCLTLASQMWDKY